MKNLNWFQADALAVTRIAVRRAAWHKWLIYEGTLWHIYTPDDPPEQHVVINTEFGADEFLAGDWTDEPWDDAEASQPPPGARPPNPAGAPLPPRGGAGGESGEWTSPENPHDPIAVDPPPFIPPGRPAPPGGGDDTPPAPVPDATPSGDPTVTVAFFTQPEALTGVDRQMHCYPSFPDSGADDNQTLDVEVTIAGGPAGIGTLSVALPGSTTQLGTAWRGFNGGFTFTGVTVTPGGSKTCTVTYTIGGTPYTGTAVFTFAPNCGYSA